MSGMDELLLCALILVCVHRLRRDLYKIRPSYKLLKHDLNHPAHAAWSRIREVNLDRGYIIYTTFTVGAFNKLFDAVYPEYASGEPARSEFGRPTTLEQRDYLAMTLFYLHSVTSLNVIASLFNCPHSTCSRNIRKTLYRLESRLPHIEEAKIRWPTVDECYSNARLILEHMRRKGNTGEYVPGYPIGFMDGCNLPVRRHRDHRIADKYYATWKRHHTVSNLFVWAPDGTIIHSTYNAPGSTPDSAIASEAYRQVKQLPREFTILADSAFARQGGRIVTTQAMELLSARPQLRARNKQIASIRVAAEWGNAGLQAAWLRLTEELPTYDLFRRTLISVCLHLHNFRTRVDNISQIRTVYDPNWVGNWRYGAPNASNLERYVESVRVRSDRMKRREQQQAAAAAKRRRTE
jgi:hypothetical protein